MNVKGLNVLLRGTKIPFNNTFTKECFPDPEVVGQMLCLYKSVKIHLLLHRNSGLKKRRKLNT